MLKVNTPVPDFELPDFEGNMHRLSKYKGKTVVINFWSADCEWSVRADKYLVGIINQLQEKAVLLPIASNVNESDDLVRTALNERGLKLALRDHGGKLSAKWDASTTPHAFVISPAGILIYQGAVDDVSFRKKIPSRFYVEEALEAMHAGRMPEVQQTVAYGCAITREE